MPKLTSKDMEDLKQAYGVYVGKKYLHLKSKIQYVITDVRMFQCSTNRPLDGLLVFDYKGVSRPDVKCSRLMGEFLDGRYEEIK